MTLASSSEASTLASQTLEISSRSSVCSCRPLAELKCESKLPDGMSDFMHRPLFREEWQTEFTIAEFQPYALRTVSCVGAIYFSCNFVYSLIAENDGGTGGDFDWKLLTVCPNAFCGLIYAFIAALISVKSLRSLCIKYYNQLCLFNIIITYCSVVAPRIILEIRRTLFQRYSLPQVHYAMNYTAFLPARSCVDTDPASTWSMALCSDDTSIGCENAVLAGGMLSTYIVLNFVSVLYCMSWKAALFACFMNCLIITFALLFTGTHGSTLLSFVALQIVGGCISAHFCRKHEIEAKKHFAIAKNIKVLSDQYSSLLYTLIPKSVFVKLSAHKGENPLAATIENCTILFCSLQPFQALQMVSEEVFQLTNEIYGKFDHLVQRYGMFKYQHVGEWYIVACPRAANPFHDFGQDHLDPTAYPLKMILLADELCALAKQYQVAGQPLWLKVGIACGSVAGAVIGRRRCFYCLYGDTVNTAARMCKASDGSICCTGAFRQFTESIPCSAITSKSVGIKMIKGKGLLEIFSMQINHNNLKEVAASLHSPEMIREDESSALPHLQTRNRPSSLMSWVLITPSRLADRIFRAFYYDLLTSAEDSIHEICTRSASFVDPTYEETYCIARASRTRKGLLAGMGIHLCTCACQWSLTVYPEYRYDFSALASPELATSTREVFWILTIHFIIAASYCSILLAAMCLYPKSMQYKGLHYIIILLIHLAVSTFAFSQLALLRGLTISFTFEMICIHAAMATLSFGPTLVLVGIAYVIFAAMVSNQGCVLAYTLAEQLAFAIVAVLLSWIINIYQRLRWRLNHTMEIELELLHLKLSDLLPLHVAKTMIQVSPKLPCERCMAAVLQLDICGFTALSQEMSPMELAEMVHGLFCSFDDAVRDKGLFKMDTIGDAYLAAALLPRLPTCQDYSHCQDEEYPIEAFSAEDAKQCEKLLYVARHMIESVAAHRVKTGLALRCRIGISLGPVLTGVLGVLQPRFHMYGPGMQFAEMLEQSGVPGAVHVSHSFARALCGRAARSRFASAEECWWLKGKGKQDKMSELRVAELRNKSLEYMAEAVAEKARLQTDYDYKCGEADWAGNPSSADDTPLPHPIDDFDTDAKQVRSPNGENYVASAEFVFVESDGRLTPCRGNQGNSKKHSAIEYDPGISVNEDTNPGVIYESQVEQRIFHIDHDSSSVGTIQKRDSASRCLEDVAAGKDDADADFWAKRGWALLWSHDHLACGCGTSVTTTSTTQFPAGHPGFSTSAAHRSRSTPCYLHSPPMASGKDSNGRRAAVRAVCTRHSLSFKKMVLWSSGRWGVRGGDSESVTRNASGLGDSVTRNASGLGDSVTRNASGLKGQDLDSEAIRTRDSEAAAATGSADADSESEPDVPVQVQVASVAHPSPPPRRPSRDSLACRSYLLAPFGSCPVDSDGSHGSSAGSMQPVVAGSSPRVVSAGTVFPEFC